MNVQIRGKVLFMNQGSCKQSAHPNMCLRARAQVTCCVAWLSVAGTLLAHLLVCNVHVGNKKAQYGCDFFVIVFI